MLRFSRGHFCFSEGSFPDCSVESVGFLVTILSEVKSVLIKIKESNRFKAVTFGVIPGDAATMPTQSSVFGAKCIGDWDWPLERGVFDVETWINSQSGRFWVPPSSAPT